MTNVTTNATTYTLLNTEETYRSLQPFATIEELNANTTEIRAQYADQMTPSTYAVLDVLHRYASKYYGVSYRSKSKIALELGVNRSTVIRACNALEAMGVIVQHALFRHNGDRRQSSNAIVFVVVIKSIDSGDATPECNAIDTPAYAQKPSTSNTYDTCACVVKDDSNVVKEERKEVPADTSRDTTGDTKELLKDSLPVGWYDQAFAYATDYNDLYRITGELFKAKVNTEIRIETHVEAFGTVLRSSYAKLKNGRINPDKWYAYLFSAFRRLSHKLERAESVNSKLHGIAAMFNA